MPIAFYLSGHGFGHASRQIEVINARLAQPGPPDTLPTDGAELAAERILGMME